eukprot:2807091-Rhodomonas_salina.2
MDMDDEDEDDEDDEDDAPPPKGMKKAMMKQMMAGDEDDDDDDEEEGDEDDEEEGDEDDDDEEEDDDEDDDEEEDELVHSCTMILFNRIRRTMIPIKPALGVNSITMILLDLRRQQTTSRALPTISCLTITSFFTSPPLHFRRPLQSVGGNIRDPWRPRKL